MVNSYLKTQTILLLLTILLTLLLLLLLLLTLLTLLTILIEVFTQIKHFFRFSARISNYEYG